MAEQKDVAKTDSDSFLLRLIDLLEDTRFSNRLPIVVLNYIRQVFAADYGCIVRLDKQHDALSIMASSVRGNPRQWDLDHELLFAYLKKQRPVIPPKFALAPISDNRCEWGVLVLGRENNVFTSREIRLLIKASSRLSIELTKRREKSATQALEELNREIARPINLYVNALAAIRRFINLDHSATLFVLNQEDHLLIVRTEVLAQLSQGVNPESGTVGSKQQITRGNSPRVGAEFPLRPEISSFLSNCKRALYFDVDTQENWVVQDNKEDTLCLQHEFLQQTVQLFLNPNTQVKERSMLCLPLAIAGNTLGFVKLSSTYPNAFLLDKLEQRLLEKFIDRIASALFYSDQYEVKRQTILAQKELERQLQRREKEQQALRTIAGEVTKTRNEDELLQLILTKALAISGAPTGNIMMNDARRDELIMRAGIGTRQDISVTSQKIGEGIVGQAAQRREAIRVGNVTIPPWSGIYLPFIGEHICSELAMPIQAENRLLGVLNVESPKLNAFSEEDEKLLEDLAAWVSMVVEMERLVQEEKKRRNLEASLREIGNALQATLDLSELAKAILSQVNNLVACDSASLMLLIQGKLEPVAAKNHDWSRLWEVADRLGGNPRIQDMLTNSKPYFVPDVSKEPTWIAREYSPDTRAWVGAPLVIKGKAIGLLNLESQTVAEYDEEEANLLMTFAQQAALAIDNARAHAELERRVQRLDQLRAVGQKMVSSINLRDVSLHIVEGAKQILNCDCAVVYPFDALKPDYYDRGGIAATGLRTHQELRDKPRREKGMASMVRNLGSLVVRDLRREKPELLASSFIRRERIKAFVGVALNVAQEQAGQMCVGVLYINFRKSHDFTKEELDLIQVYANQAALAIGNAQKYGVTDLALHDQLMEMETLRNLDEAVASALSLEEVLNQILEKSAKLVGAAHGSLGLVRVDHLELRAWLGADWTDEKKQLRLTLGNGITGWVAKQRRPWLSPPNVDVSGDPQYFALFDNVRSELAVPLLSSQRTSDQPRVLGVLNVDSPETGHFTKNHLRILQDAAARGVVAIEKAQARVRLETLVGISSKISSTLDLDEVLQYLVLEMGNSFRAAENGININLYLYDSEKQWLNLHRHSLYQPTEGEKVPKGLPLGQGIVGWAAKTRQTKYAPDVLRDKHYIPRIESTRSEVDTPILSKDGELLGVLGLQSSESDAFHPQDIMLLEGIAQQAAIAIQNAESTDVLLANALAVNALMWAHSVTQRSSAIQGAARVLRHRVKEDDEAAESALREIESSATLLKDIVPDSSPDDVDDSGVDLDQVIRNAHRKCGSSLHNIAMKYQGFRALPKVQGNDAWLERIFIDLFTNSSREMNGSGTIQVHAQAKDDKVTLRICDDGPGFPSEILENGVNGRPRNPRGKGIGLWLAKRTVRIYGGTLHLANRKRPSGAIVTITLPVWQQVEERPNGTANSNH